MPVRTLMGAVLMAMCSGLFAQSDSLPELHLDSLLNLSISSVSKYSQTTTEAPASVTIISREEIQHYGYNDLGELLNGVRDLYITDDRNYGYLGVRGFGRPTDYNNRVGILVNGVALNENVWGSSPVTSEFHGLNLDDVERVEVVTGPASALYGNHPMLGMINIVTRTGKQHDGLTASVEHGSYGKWQASAAAGKVLRNGLDINVAARAGTIAGQDLYYPEYDDSSTNFGVASKLDGSRFYGVHGLASYKGFQLKGLYTWRDIEVPTGAFETIFGDPNFHVIDRYGYLDASYGHEWNSKVEMTGRAYLGTYFNGGYYPYDSADGGLQRELVNCVWAGLEAKLRWDIAANNRLMVGLESQDNFHNKYYLDYPERVEFDQNFKYLTAAAYVQDEWQLHRKFSVTGGLRLERLYLGRLALVPRLAANWFIGKAVTMKFLYGEAFRAPSIYEVNVGFDGYVLPNFALNPERIRSWEITGERHVGHGLRVAASGYYNELRNLIDQVTVQDTLLQFQNISSAGGFGGSLEFGGHVSRKFSFYSSYSYARMLNLADSTWLTNSPVHMLKGGVSLQCLKHFRLSPECLVQSGRLTVQGTETAPFALVNVTLLFAPKFTGNAAALNRFSLAFKVRNVLDVAYAYPGGYEHLQAGIVQNGRNYNLKLIMQLR